MSQKRKKDKYTFINFYQFRRIKAKIGLMRIDSSVRFCNEIHFHPRTFLTS